MKLRYTYILLFFAVSFGTASAQTDDKSSLQRTVTIEKEFTPIVQDASKINSVPELEISPSMNPDIPYAEWNMPQEEIPSLTLLPIGDNGVESPTKQRGYAQIEIGNYLNLNANAGVRIIDKKRDQLLIWYQHNSTNGTLSYIEDASKTKQRRNDNRLHLNYSHEFNHLYWLTSVHYRYNGFNYYGLPLYKMEVSDIGTTTNQQTVQQYGFNTKVTSKSDNNLHYIAEINYQAYNSDLGLLYGQRGVLENHLTTLFDGSISLDEHQVAGIALRMDNLIYNRCEKRSYTQLRINPYFTLQNEKLHFRIGLLADFSAHEGTVLRLAPDLNFEWEFERNCFFYVQLTGGKTINSWGKMSDFTIYIDPTTAMKNSYTPLDFMGGFHIQPIQKLFFTVYGGIKRCVDALFDYRQTSAVRPVVSFYNATAYAWKAGAEIQYTFCRFLDAHLSWEHDEWHAANDKKPILSAQPQNTWNMGVVITPIKPLDITADVYLANGLGCNIEQPDYEKLPNIATVNIGGIYRLNKHVHFSVQCNNLLSKHYDIFYGMPAQRFYFLVGAGVAF